MSTYIDKDINPKTSKLQIRLFIDDYYGSHRYEVAFKNDKTDADLYDAVTCNKYTACREEAIY
jgi:hypothetical protein